MDRNHPFFQQYVETALWSSNDESDPNTGGEPMDQNYSIDDISEDTLNEMLRDCDAFYNENYDLMADDDHDDMDSRGGHDFWLTRNGHGAGFWDGDWKHGDELTEASHAYGEYDLYVGDDGVIYGSGWRPRKGVSESQRIKCDSCNLMRINGVITHERGCPKSWINPSTGEGYPTECWQCGSDFIPEDRPSKYSICPDCANPVKDDQEDN